MLSLESQLRKFSVSALRVGFTREDVVEAIIQTAPYGGFPRALNALAALDAALQYSSEFSDLHEEATFKKDDLTRSLDETNKLRN